MKDLFGVACSSLCIIHCLATPVLLAAGIPIVGLSALEGEGTHLFFAILVVVVALWSFPSGWRSHKNLIPGALALAGLSFLLLTPILGESMELALAIIAGLILITAHLVNRKLILKRLENSVA
jgi:hypothetical protein